MAKSSKNKFLSFLKIFLPLGIGVFLLWHFYNSMDTNAKEVFFKALREANYLWIILSIFLGIISHAIRAYRWKYMLEPLGYHTKFKHRFYAVMSGYMINLLIPRAGEASRAALLYGSDEVPFPKSFGTIISERIFDTFTLGIILLITLFISFEDLINIKNILVAGTLEESANGNKQWVFILILSVFILGALILTALLIKSRKFREKVKQFIIEIIFGVFAIFKSKRPFHFVSQTLLIWILYILYFAVSFYAFDETKSFPLNGILIGFIAGTLGIAFTNGGIGAYPYLVGIVVTYYIGDLMSSPEQAEGIGKALGMIIWASQTLMMIVLGLISLILIPKKYKKENNEKVGTNTI